MRDNLKGEEQPRNRRASDKVQQGNLEAQDPNEGVINPSAPTAGTEGWGHFNKTEDANIGGSNPTDSQPSAEGAGDVRRTSYPRNEAAENPAAKRDKRAA